MKTKLTFLTIAISALLGVGMLMAFKQEEAKSVILIRVIERGPSSALIGLQPLEPAIYVTENGKLLFKTDLERSIDDKLIINYERISSVLTGYINKGYELKTSSIGSYTIGALNNPFSEYILIKN